MKKFLNPIIVLFVNTKIGWYLSKMLMRFSEWLRYEKSKIENELTEDKLKKYFKDLKVEHGHFAGLKYKSFSSFGSSLFPKLSGSYESELTSFFDRVENVEYKNIIDVGCAEGYYAVGLARKHPNSTIIAFDIEETARELCKNLAIENAVENRIVIHSECNAEWIKTINVQQRNLLICDCEGYERKLFTENNFRCLENTDLLIELHPMFEKDVKEYLFELFKSTHKISFIASYDDNRKIFDLPIEYKNFSFLEKLKIVQEGRSFSMDWLVAYSKK